MNKNELREWAKGVREIIPERQRQSDSEKLKKNVIAAMNYGLRRNGGDLIIGTYQPIGTEIIPPFVTATPSKDGAHAIDPIGPVSSTGMQ